MGVDVHVMLVDRRAYAHLVENHRRWVAGRDSGAVLTLLREAVERVRKLAPHRTTRRQRMDEIGRRLDALPEAPEGEAEGERFERTIEDAAGQLLEARARGGDPAVEARAMDEVSRTFLGALIAPLRRNDERGALLREMVAIHEDPPGPGIELVEALEPAIAALSGAAAPSGQRGDEIPWSSLLDAYALAWDREPRADILVDLFLPFEHSSSLEELVGFARGEALLLDDSAQFFSDEQVTLFRDELGRIPDPAPKAPERVARVRRLVELSASDPQLGLASRVR
jgi:hypothetical protein